MSNHADTSISGEKQIARIEDVTSLLVHFFQMSGLSKSQMMAVFSKAIDSLPDTLPDSGARGFDPGIASAIGSAFHTWFRSRDFIGRDGQPVALPISGGARSVEALLARENPKEPPSKIAKELMSLGLLKSAGRDLYRPTTLHGLIRTEHPYASEYVVSSVLRFLHTVSDNLRLGGGGSPMIERYAHASSIPASMAQEYRDFSNQQGEALIDTVNDWLESNRIDPLDPAAVPAIQAGLHVFAYLAEESTASPPTPPAAPVAESSRRSSSGVRRGR